MPVFSETAATNGATTVFELIDPPAATAIAPLSDAIAFRKVDSPQHTHHLQPAVGLLPAIPPFIQSARPLVLTPTDSLAARVSSRRLQHHPVKPR